MSGHVSQFCISLIDRVCCVAVMLKKEVSIFQRAPEGNSPQAIWEMLAEALSVMLKGAWMKKN